eukprot:2619902-Pyramimonas_sp.AAC.1
MGHAHPLLWRPVQDDAQMAPAGGASGARETIPRPPRRLQNFGLAATSRRWRTLSAILVRFEHWSTYSCRLIYPS